MSDSANASDTKPTRAPAEQERPDQAYIDYTTDRMLEDAMEADFGGDTFADYGDEF